MSLAPEVTARELRGLVRSWRRERVDTTLWEQLSEAYIWVFSGVVIGAMAVSALVQTRVSVAAGCTAESCDQARTSLVWVGALFVVAASLAALRAVGPVLVTPATATWLLSTPVDRRPVLRARLVVAAVVSAVACSASLAVTALLAGFDYAAVAVVSGAGLLAGGAAAVAAARWQPGGGTWTRRVAFVLAAAGWLWLVAIALDRTPSTTPAWVTALPGWVTLGLLALTTAALARSCVSRLSLLLRADLVPGGSLLASLSGALASLDLSLAYDVLVARRWRTAATVRPVRGGPGGLWALVWRDVVRLRRSLGAVTALAATVVVPYVVVTLGLDDVLAPLSALAAGVVTLSLCSALRTTGTSPGLVRCFPMSVQTVRYASLVVPAAVLTVWSLAAAPAVAAATDGAPLGDVVLVSLATGAAALCSAARWLLAAPPDYSAPLVSSPAGAVPTGLLGSTLRGFDVLALLTVPLIVSPTDIGAMVSLVLATIVLSAVLSRK